MTDRDLSDTPRTDAMCKAGYAGYDGALADFARQLECEADHLRAQLRMCVENGKAADKANRAEIARLVGELAEARRLIDECAPYLKVGETPAERIKREFLDCQAVTSLLAEARRIIERHDLRNEEDAPAQLKMQQELAEARAELEVWSRRYADLEVLYLAAMKS